MQAQATKKSALPKATSHGSVSSVTSPQQFLAPFSTLHLSSMIFLQLKDWLVVRPVFDFSISIIKQKKQPWSWKENMTPLTH